MRKAGQIHGNKAVALLIVLAAVVMVVLMANMVLNIVANQARMDQYKLSRIQAYYAAQAGANLAREMLRSGAAHWPLPAVGGSYIHRICNGCVIGPGDVNEPNLPDSVRSVIITVSDPALCPGSPAGLQACIRVTANY